MFTDDIKKSIQESVLCWLATSSKNGEPNCSPKEAFTFRGEAELVIANIASPDSVRNIEVNPSVCVSFVNVFTQKGYKLKGRAKYISPENDSYLELFKLVEPIVGKTFPVMGIILVSVERASPIIAPAYYMVNGTTEESQIRNARKAYGV